MTPPDDETTRSSTCAGACRLELVEASPEASDSTRPGVRRVAGRLVRLPGGQPRRAGRLRATTWRVPARQGASRVIPGTRRAAARRTHRGSQSWPSPATSASDGRPSSAAARSATARGRTSRAEAWRRATVRGTAADCDLARRRTRRRPNTAGRGGAPRRARSPAAIAARMSELRTGSPSRVNCGTTSTS